MSLSTYDVINLVIGSVGSLLMLIAYFLLNFNKQLGRFGLDEDTWTYNWLNFVGGALASASAVLAAEPGSYPLSVLEGVWSIVGLVGLFRLMYERYMANKFKASIQQ